MRHQHQESVDHYLIVCIIEPYSLSWRPLWIYFEYFKSSAKRCILAATPPPTRRLSIMLRSSTVWKNDLLVSFVLLPCSFSNVTVSTVTCPGIPSNSKVYTSRLGGTIS